MEDGVVRQEQVISYRNIRSEVSEDKKTSYFVPHGNGEVTGREEIVGLTAKNYMTSSRIVALERPEIPNNYFVELPPLAVDMLTMVESMGISDEEREKIARRKFYYYQDDCRDNG